MANDTSKVGAATGVRGGYLFAAAAGTELPTNYNSDLSDEYLCMGFVSDDGLSFEDDISTDEHQDLNGDTVDVTRSSITCTMTATLLEQNVDALKVLYGDANVDESDEMITVYNTGEAAEHHVIVCELILKNKKKLRKVIPDAEVTSLGTLTAVAGDLYAREATFTLYPVENAQTAEHSAYWIDYEQKDDSTDEATPTSLKAEAATASVKKATTKKAA